MPIFNLERCYDDNKKNRALAKGLSHKLHINMMRPHRPIKAVVFSPPRPCGLTSSMLPHTKQSPSSLTNKDALPCNLSLEHKSTHETEQLA